MRCHAHLIARTAANLADTANAVRAHGVTCETVTGDLDDDILAAHAAAHTDDRLGPPTLLVNNGGVSQFGSPMLASTTGGTWSRSTCALRSP